MHRLTETAKLRGGAGWPLSLRWAMALLVCLVMLCLKPVLVLAEDIENLQPLPPVAYVVQPGDTLAGIAELYGVTPADLAYANGIQTPRYLYPGQTLSLASAPGTIGSIHSVSWGGDLLTLSRSVGVTSRTLAQINGLLRPTALQAGLTLWVPQRAPLQIIPAIDPALGHGSSVAPRIGTAVLYGVRLWDALWLNPVPYSADQLLFVPASAAVAASALAPDELVTSIQLSPQPVARGETGVVVVETSEPVTCMLSYLDQTESCVGGDGPRLRWLGLVGLSPLLDPGVFTLTLTLMTSAGQASVVPVPILVSAGRYDYERIDLPPDRQSLLDPELSQAERDKIAVLRLLRSPVRYWSYPFERPVGAAVTSYFGSRRSYGYGFSSYHAGSDFDGLGGEPVLAPADGVVILAEPLVVRGNAIMMDHGWGVVSGFWHLSEIEVSVGDRVSQGQRIAALGNTGLSTGAHLHWELWVNGSAVNALSWLEPDGPAALLGAMP